MSDAGDGVGAGFRPEHREHEHSIVLDAVLDAVAPLFTPSGERLWVEGWDPRSLHPLDGGDREGAVFATGSGPETTLWTTVVHAPERGAFRYVRVTPASRSAVVDVRLRRAGPATQVTVRYAVTALNEAGNAWIAGWTEEAFRAFIEGWRRDLHAYLAAATNVAAVAPPAAPGSTRAAERDDAAAIARIYNQGIEERIATFETDPRDTAAIQAWFDAPYPVVVGLEGERVVAFGSTSMYRARACYRDVAEVSLYVEREARERGHGERVLRALFTAARAAGLRKLVSRVFVENAASRRLLGRVGFREVGVYRRHGRLDGVWRDAVIVERLLDEPDPPAP